MKLLQLAAATEFINRLTGNKITESQNRKAVAYLRAKKVVFYDDWSRTHVLILDHSVENKKTVLEALRYSLN